MISRLLSSRLSRRRSSRTILPAASSGGGPAVLETALRVFTLAGTARLIFCEVGGLAGTAVNPGLAPLKRTGSQRVKALPLPSSLSTVKTPPRNRASSLDMESPRPVPPNLRLVVPSACLKASKTISSLSAGIPMPLSLTRKKRISSRLASANSGGKAPTAGRPTVKSTAPCSVNLKELESRFFNTWSNRASSVKITAGASSSRTRAKPIFFCSARGLKGASSETSILSRVISSGLISIRPASILERSSTSLIRLSRSAPELWIVAANSTCLGNRLVSLLAASNWESIRILFKGVRSS